MEEKTLKQWIEEGSEWAKGKVHNGLEHFNEHKEEISVLLSPLLIGGFIGTCKLLAKHRESKEEKFIKEWYIYDRSNGHCYELKKKPENSEWLQMDEYK